MLNSASSQAAILAASLSLSIVGIVPARAHDAPTGWKYPFACCSNMDCHEVEAKAVSERPDGYVVQSTGEVLAYNDSRVKNSPDGEYHWCAHQAGTHAGETICLFVPPKGF